MTHAVPIQSTRIAHETVNVTEQNIRITGTHDEHAYTILQAVLD